MCTDVHYAEAADECMTDAAGEAPRESERERDLVSSDMLSSYTHGGDMQHAGCLQ